MNIGQSGTFWKRFAPLFGVGLVGVAAIVPLVARQIQTLGGDNLASAPPLPLIVGAALLQTSVLVGAAVAAGVALAPRLGLRSHLAEKAATGARLVPALRAELPFALAGGVASFALVAGLDQVFKPFMLEAWQAMNAVVSHTDMASIVGGILYGGIVEELLLRWGVMTLLAWAGWRLIQGRVGKPRPAIMWSANILAALLFGALHLPMTATMTTLTAVVIVRGLLLNSIAGIIFGWLYWRKSLEAAMIAHAAFHISATVVALATKG
jgi:hypothetical protein